MELADKVVVVTGGGSGIGEALVSAFARRGAAGIAVADLDEGAAVKLAEATAKSGVPAIGVGMDAGDEAAVRELVRRTETELGPVDVFCANAGILAIGGIEAAEMEWDRSWQVNVKSHVYAARAVLPGMIERGRGYLVHTASAAGLLTQLGAAPYAVTKHAVVALAEWIAITHGDQGIGVSCVCPQAVRTAMSKPIHDREDLSTVGTAGSDGLLEPEQVAETTLNAIVEERFLVLPHPEVAIYEQRRATERERWLRGMRRAQAAMPAAMVQGFTK